ncbi:unnamed protein product [Caenorhabditis brenneri]
MNTIGGPFAFQNANQPDYDVPFPNLNDLSTFTSIQERSDSRAMTNEDSTDSSRDPFTSCRKRMHAPEEEDQLKAKIKQQEDQIGRTIVEKKDALRQKVRCNRYESQELIRIGTDRRHCDAQLEKKDPRTMNFGMEKNKEFVEKHATKPDGPKTEVSQLPKATCNWRYINMSAECSKIVERKSEAARKKKGNEEVEKSRENIQPMPSSSSVEERWQWKLEIPNGLEKIVLDDQKLIEKGSLVKIPAQFPVEAIFEKYLESLQINRNGPKTGEEQLTQHHIEMIIDYFNLYFRSKILYKAEQGQYKKLRKEAKKNHSRFLPSEHYGLIHLARSFDVIPSVLELKLEDEKHFKNITPVVQKFIEWLDDNKEMFYNKNKSYMKC